MLEDLEPGGWLYDEEDADPVVLYSVYRHQHEEFQDVPFDQFKVRLNEYRKQTEKRRARSKQEEEWMVHDRQIHPRQSHNHRGEPVFDLDEAKTLLRGDIENGLHKTMTPMELRESRTAYQKFTINKFRPRIYQEIRRNKYMTYLDHKRTEKRRQFQEKKKKQSST